jgi:regulator of protease activity HflC (stomatin/prohibitin superfamily)
MEEYVELIGLIIFLLLLVYLFSRIKLVSHAKTGFIERHGEFYKAISPGVYFAIPFYDRIVTFDVENKFYLNREIIIVNGEPKLSLSLCVPYKVIDERNFHDQNVDQFMKDLLIETTKQHIRTFGSNFVSKQHQELVDLLKNTLTKKVVEWGIQLSEVELLMAMEIPSHR